jgi:sugar lactone lactonase YvrE
MRSARYGLLPSLGIAALMLVTSLLVSPATASEPPVRDWLDIRVFAEVPEPGYPEGMAVAPDGTVYVGTHQQVLDLPGPRSRVFAYDRDGNLLRTYEIEGQDPSRGAGLLGMALDADDVLFIVDRYPQRVLALYTRTGAQWDYATFEQVRRLCVPTGVLILLTMCAYADDIAFAADGTMYVTDVAQGLIWRVPPGGGAAQQWFTDPRIISPAGPNGIEVMADGSTIMFAQTIFGPVETFDRLTGGDPGVPGTTHLYTLSVNDDGSPGDLEVLWEGRPGDGIDGFAIATSGNVYVALGLGNAVAVISPHGVEIGRSPANEVENLLLDVPMDTPGSVKFLDDRVLVSNHAPFLAAPGAHVVFDLYAGEPGLPKFRPSIPRPAEPPPPFERTCTLMLTGWCIA